MSNLGFVIDVTNLCPSKQNCAVKMAYRKTKKIGVSELNMVAYRVGPLRKTAEEKVRADRAAAVAGFRSLLSEKGEISSASRWSKVKEV